MIHEPRCVTCHRALSRCRCDYLAAQRLLRILATIIVIAALVKLLEGLR